MEIRSLGKAIKESRQICLKDKNVRDWGHRAAPLSDFAHRTLMEKPLRRSTKRVACCRERWQRISGRSYALLTFNWFFKSNIRKGFEKFRIKLASFFPSLGQPAHRRRHQNKAIHHGGVTFNYLLWKEEGKRFEERKMFREIESEVEQSFLLFKKKGELNRLSFRDVLRMEIILSSTTRSCKCAADRS